MRAVGVSVTYGWMDGGMALWNKRRDASSRTCEAQKQHWNSLLCLSGPWPQVRFTLSEAPSRRLLSAGAQGARERGRRTGRHRTAILKFQSGGTKPTAWGRVGGGQVRSGQAVVQAGSGGRAVPPRVRW